ncbi:glycosyltransferase family 1 protein [Trametes coccinea BRFM310]|uniref:Glycosyltransferase family 1 protein n=1 Tax=Trametes coccinea (strain BRFM310) TaxID=1353009 RepID=A0A1Y2I702_TRAC3|nr:glycosyltransferase family 1 protein [Trametes coccinea BRFM310]
MAIESLKHILLLPAHMWGHSRAMSILAGRMVRMRPVVVTLCVADKLWEKTMAEIKSDFAPEEAHYLSRIHLLRIQQGNDHFDPTSVRDHFMERWSKLCAGVPVPYEAVDGSTGVIDLRASPLSGVVIDGMVVEVIEALHKQKMASPRPLTLRLYLWTPVCADFLVAMFRTDPMPFIEAVQKQQNISFDEAAVAVLGAPKQGRVIESPCLPPMYDYEYEPQGYVYPRELLPRVMAKVAGSALWTDGMLTLDAYDYHPEASLAFRAHLAEHGKKGYYAGPLISARHPIPSAADAKDAEESLQFMDRQLKVHGPRSVIYISFGSLFWPQDPAKLTAALDVLIEQKIPFVMSRPSPVAKLSDDVVQRLADNPNVYLGNWLPQQALLDHPAMGWCLSHGGHNTVLECIHSGTPMIIWPITVDQPANAVHLTYNVDMAYELMEVRNGVGAGPLRRTGKAPLGTLDAVRDELRDVLLRAFGTDGAAKRQRLLGLRDTLEKAWTEGGIARQEVGQFLDDVMALPTSTLFPDQDA